LNTSLEESSSIGTNYYGLGEALFCEE